MGYLTKILRTRLKLVMRTKPSIKRTDKANAKEAARYKSGPNRDDMTTRRVVAAKRARRAKRDASTMMDGGKVEGYKKGGKIDGVAMKGKTKGRMCKMAIARTSMGSQLSWKQGEVTECQKKYASPIENTQNSGEEVSSC